MLPGEKAPQVQISHIASLYQENKQQVETLTRSVKSQYLQGTSAKEIFVADSAVQRVDASLTKLEQLDMVNQQYLKDNNVTGLQNIHIILEPLFTS
ncbi:MULTISPECIES: hypothetical protein [unclassified Enterobacter cloacae complex]|uniref:hypothetical protein n=1 Tax=unclassified Enterobacter cloacae complex TaxID=2757714 RepID=UPI001D028EEA|nr:MULTISPECIES: hypothetical protein [unclassified Enterobacter cloacae complex]